MSQVGRNLTDTAHGILNGKRYLIHDLDPLFTTESLNMVADVGVESVKLATAISENQRARRETRAEHQGILSGADNPIRRGVVGDSHFQLRRSLSHRAQSVETRQPAPWRPRLGGMLNLGLSWPDSVAIPENRSQSRMRPSPADSLRVESLGVERPNCMLFPS